VQYFKLKVVDQPFVNFLLSNGLAIGIGFLLVKLFGLELGPKEIIITSLAIIGTASQGLHSALKKDGGQ
jgi:hypothetical protein